MWAEYSYQLCLKAKVYAKLLMDLCFLFSIYFDLCVAFPVCLLRYVRLRKQKALKCVLLKDTRLSLRVSTIEFNSLFEIRFP